MESLPDYSLEENPLLAAVDDIQRRLNVLRDMVVRQESVPSSFGEDLTLKKAAEILEQNYSTLVHGDGDTRCLYLQRIKKGKRVYLPKNAVMRHRAIVLANGWCDGKCKEENK